MTAARICLATLLLTAPVGSTTPCPSHRLVGEHRPLELISVRVDGVPIADVAAYRGYEVSLRADALTERLDRSPGYVRFRADRRETGSFGREQVESLSEFYPTRSTVPSPFAAPSGGSPE